MYLRIKVLAVLSILFLFRAVGMMPVFEGKTDREIKPYITWVKELSNGKLKAPAGVGFAWTKDEELANYWQITNEIRVNKKEWDTMDSMEKILLIAHEMGHYCGAKHRNERPGICFKSFMGYKSQSRYCNRLNYDNYIKEMQNFKCKTVDD